ncbi:methyltransferase domain-containing protein [Nocardioides aurantiacus]|uniref:Trans-aconitate 2-methyltransferase n=1 Tax=Nocardioides aurantiacus TaxID=86796 RepID=A0A3N2CR57_9ACTN|nr:methyltransferase domain-containing protein [Nocardioides aurantiacus]ROR90027.1 trans-aconitate 2-methyltransferase [Nocardioides aurantiacus]
MAFSWDPARYLGHADHRARPFHDLLARVDADDPDLVVDLGCGAGNLTALLPQRWPDARVVGIDSSEAMVDRAREVADVELEVGDVRDWPARGLRPEVLISNAVLHWLPDHLELLPALAATVAPGGWLALQVPGNWHAPSHSLVADLAARAPYDEHTRDVARMVSHAPEDYLWVLRGLGWEVDAWETTYAHVLTGADAVFDWISGTGLRPTVQALPEGLRGEFEEELKQQLRAAYPERDGVVVMPFRRVFAVARRP